MKIVWLPVALIDLTHIKKFFAEEASAKVVAGQLSKISKPARLLTSHPYMGHPSPNLMDRDVLEWDIPSTPYTLPFLIVGEEIRILRVFDQRQDRPDSWH